MFSPALVACLLILSMCILSWQKEKLNPAPDATETKDTMEKSPSDASPSDTESESVGSEPVVQEEAMTTASA